MVLVLLLLTGSRGVNVASNGKLVGKREKHVGGFKPLGRDGDRTQVYGTYR